MPKISEENKLIKKKYIIDHAMQLFSVKGYAETSMDDIVKSTKMSKGGIYNYFKSKEEIFLAIAEGRFKSRHRLVEEFSKDMTNKEKIEKYINWVLMGLFSEELKLNAKFTFEFWSVLSRNEQMSIKAKERYKLFYDDLSGILKDGVECGEFCEDLDVDSMVYLILSTTDGIAFCNSVMNIPINEEIVKNYLSMILNKIVI